MNYVTKLIEPDHVGEVYYSEYFNEEAVLVHTAPEFVTFKFSDGDKITITKNTFLREWEYVRG